MAYFGREYLDRLTRCRSRQVFQRYERANFQVLDVRHLAEDLAAGDFFAGPPFAADDDAGKRRAHIGALQLVVDLADPHPRDIGVADREITIRLGLLDFELRDEIRGAQLALPTQLTFQLANVDLCAFEQRLLLRALQQQRCLV